MPKTVEDIEVELNRKVEDIETDLSAHIKDRRQADIDIIFKVVEVIDDRLEKNRKSIFAHINNVKDNIIDSISERFVKYESTVGRIVDVQLEDKLPEKIKEHEELKRKEHKEQVVKGIRGFFTFLKENDPWCVFRKYVGWLFILLFLIGIITQGVRLTVQKTSEFFDSFQGSIIKEVERTVRSNR